MAYTATIIGSSRELTAKERIAFKDMQGAIGIDSALAENGDIILTPECWVDIAIHNDNSKREKDYNKIVIVDTAGNRFSTGSETFSDALKNIMAEMEGIDEEYQICITRKPSKNYEGKNFLTCYIM